MTKTIGAVLDAPTVLRLDEAVDFPLHVPMEVTIHDPEQPADDHDPFLALIGTVQIEAPVDFSERFEDYQALDEHERAR